MVLAVIATAFLFFEVIRSQLPAALLVAIDKPGAAKAWLVAAAIGSSLLCTGVGAMFVSAVRLLLVLRKPEEAAIRTSTADHLVSVAMVIVGFILCVAALFVLGSNSA